MTPIGPNLTLIIASSGSQGSLGVGGDLCQNFRGFEFRGDPNVYIQRKIQEAPVLENISSSALGPKTGSQEADFNFKPNCSDFDHFDKMVSSSMGWKG